MTALSIAETERRPAVDPQVAAVGRPRDRAPAELASVTDLTTAARRKYGAPPEITRRAGVSRAAGVARAGVSRSGVSRPSAGALRQAAPARPIRLTARGRAVVASLAGAVAVCVCSLLAASGAAAASHGSPAGGYQGMHQIVVERGETLWSIASAAEPTADPLAVIQQIVIANVLASSTIHAGQVLWVPRG